MIRSLHLQVVSGVEINVVRACIDPEPKAIHAIQSTRHTIPYIRPCYGKEERG